MEANFEWIKRTHESLLIGSALFPSFSAEVEKHPPFPCPKVLGTHVGFPPETAFVFIQFKRTSRGDNTGSATCWAKSLSFLICQTGTARIRRHHTGEGLSTWTTSSKSHASHQGVSLVGHAMHSIKKDRWREEGRDLAGEWVPDGLPAWDAGDKNPIPRLGVGWGCRARRESQSKSM